MTAYQRFMHDAAIVIKHATDSLLEKERRGQPPDDAEAMFTKRPPALRQLPLMSFINFFTCFKKL